MVESILRDERVVTGASVNGHVDERNKGNEEVTGRFAVKERKLEAQIVVDFAEKNGNRNGE